MTQLKVVFCHYDLLHDVGGVSTWIQALVPDLRRQGLDIRVHILSGDNEPGPNILHFQRLGIPLSWAKSPPTLLQGVKQCVSWINQDRPDIYVPNSILPAAYAGAYASQFGLKTVGVLHSDDSFFSGIVEELVAKENIGRLSEVVAVSDFLQRKVEALGIPNIPCHRIPCGVPIPDSSTKFELNRFRIAYLGRFTEEAKQVSKVTRSLCEALSRHPNLEAVMIGDGPARPSVEKIIAAHPDKARIQLTGLLSNQEVFSILKDIQALVLLSDYEGLPVSVLEAMATGVVPICLNVRSGLKELLISGENGLIVEDRGESFQRAVGSLINNPELWNKCSHQARRTVAAQFSREICHEKWYTVLSRLGQTSGKFIPYPIPVPKRTPTPNPLFRWHEPDALDLLLPALTPVRDRVGRLCRRSVSWWRAV